MRIDGLISQKAITRMLEEYEYLVAGDVSPDAPPTNSGPKSYDGISGARMNKIMIDQAIDSLSPLMRACIRAKYVHRLTEKEATRALGIGKSVYRQRIAAGRKHMYYDLNGLAANTLDLLNAIVKA